MEFIRFRRMGEMDGLTGQCPQHFCTITAPAHIERKQYFRYSLRSLGGENKKLSYRFLETGRQQCVSVDKLLSNAVMTYSYLSPPKSTSGKFVTHRANKLQHATAVRANDARPHCRLMSHL